MLWGLKETIENVVQQGEYVRMDLLRSNVRLIKASNFSGNKFWKNIGCMISDTTFGFEGKMLWDNQQNMNVKIK